jgi:hypothetical protein
MAVCVLMSGNAWTEESDPKPLSEVAWGAGEEEVIDVLGKVPLGKIPVAVYKVVDFGRELGVAATEREDQTLGADMILMNADAALLKGMHARGLDTNEDSQAIAAKNRLSIMVQAMDSGDGNRWVRLGAVTMNHLPYAIARVGLNKGLTAAAGRLIKWAGPRIDSALPFGDGVHDLMGNRSPIATGLRYAGWSKLGARANLAKHYTDELTHQLLQAELDELVSARLKKAFGSALDDIFNEAMDEHPSVLRRTVIRNPALYAAIAATAMPAQALPMAAVAAVPEAAEPHEEASDRLADGIQVEDRYMISVSGRGGRAPSGESSPPAVQLSPEPPSKPAWQAELHEALKCQGVNKPGCGTWDGRQGQGQSVTGR